MSFTTTGVAVAVSANTGALGIYSLISAILDMEDGNHNPIERCNVIRQWQGG